MKNMVQPGYWKTSRAKERTDNKWKETVVRYSVLETFHPLRCKQVRSRNKPANELLMNGLKDNAVIQNNQISLFLSNSECLSAYHILMSFHLYDDDDNNSNQSD
jgi:hypothetical protein